ncbi:MAG: HAMP domain-containing histidine kinase [Balneolaceae bacterium]|nr:HAMP domain-containing histidine kinase [Balneolaceae bacterium]
MKKIRVNNVSEKNLYIIALFTAAVLIIVNQFAILMKYGNSFSELLILEAIFASTALYVFLIGYRFIVKPIFEKLRKKNGELEGEVQNKDRVLATVVHDLRNPLMGIKGMVDLIREDHLNEISDEQEMMFKVINDSHNKADSLIKELLEYSVMESEEYHLKTQVTHIEEYLCIVLSQFRERAREKGVNIKIDVKDRLKVSLDREKFSRVMDNLITNALKFTDGPGEVKVLSYKEDGRVVIKVKDSGIGIPDEMQDHIFDQFSKARRLGLKGEKSTGLGMSIAKKIVELHDGTIRVESRENYGTAFYISLPA